jgi:hypothetical protein
MLKHQEAKVYILHLIQDGTSDPVEIRMKIRDGKYVRYCSDKKEGGFISCKEFYNIPKGFKCILKNK